MEKINFCDNWLFHKGDIKENIPSYKGYAYMAAKTESMLIGPASKNYLAYAESYDANILHSSDRWDVVTLPHDYIFDTGFYKEENNALGFVKYDNAWYIKHFKIDEEDFNKKIYINFEGITCDSVVYINGSIIKRNFGGYNPFFVDITNYVYFDKENTISVYVNTERHEGWWYEGGGIYRPAYLIKTNLFHFDFYGVYVKPTYKDNKWTVDVETTLCNESDELKNYEIKYQIIDKNNNVLYQDSYNNEVNANTNSIVNYSSKTVKPLLWSPDEANMYKMVTELFVNGELVDTNETSFGFRTYYIDPDKGLFINDKHYKINGVCAHIDCGLFGKAVPENVQQYKIKMIKDMGANGYRTSHYPHSDVVMNALDENGFIVLDETRRFETCDEAKEQLVTLIKRDRNHPSIFFWSIGNEEKVFVTENGRRIFKELKNIAVKLDDTREILCCVDLPLQSKVFGDSDVIGINYNLQSYEEVKKTFPNKAILSSECCATGTTRSNYLYDYKDLATVSSYDKDTNAWFVSREHTYEFLNSKDYIIGSYQWMSFEHLGEATWPRICSVSGAIDCFLNKKDAFYQNQSLFSKQQMVHILPHWNFEGFENELVRIVVYTNCPKVKIIVNDKVVYEGKAEFGKHLEVSVPYQKGYIEAIAESSDGITVTDKKVTSGKAFKICLKQENTNVTNNGKDYAIFSCFVIDEDGNEVFDYNGDFNFATSGDCMIYSSGSSNFDHSPIKSSNCKMYEGRISIAVQIGKEKDVKKIYAKSSNLVSAVQEIKYNK